MKGQLLSRTEEIILAAVASLGVSGQAYGVSVFDQCQHITNGRYVSLGSIYTTLERLEKKGFIESWFEESNDPARGNRGKRCFRMTGLGARALRDIGNLNEMIRLAWGSL